MNGDERQDGNGHDAIGKGMGPMAMAKAMAPPLPTALW